MKYRVRAHIHYQFNGGYAIDRYLGEFGSRRAALAAFRWFFRYGLPEKYDLSLYAVGG